MMIDFSPLQKLNRDGALTSSHPVSDISPHLQALSDENRAKLENAAKVYAKYQKNTLVSDNLQCEINKGLKSGEDIYVLFLKAVKAISLMTNNSAFYDVARKDLISIYGAGLKEPPALEIELKDVQTRLDKLRAASRDETDSDNVARIKTAVEWHEKEVSRIEKQIEKSIHKTA